MAITLAQPYDQGSQQGMGRPAAPQHHSPQAPGMYEQLKKQAAVKALDKGMDTGFEYLEGLSAAPETETTSTLAGPISANPLPGSLQANVTKSLTATPKTAAQMFANTGPVAAPAGGPLASATTLPGSLASNVTTSAMAPSASSLMGAGTAAGTTAAGTGAATTAGAASPGMLAAAGPAAPYVAAGLAADELLGLGIRKNILGFNAGGLALGGGPLALQMMKKAKDENKMPLGGIASMFMEYGGPVSKVKYAAKGGEVNESIEVQYNKGPLA